MMIVASAIPNWGFTGNLIAMLPGTYYYATPENNGSELLNPFVKDWLVPHDPMAIKYFLRDCLRSSVLVGSIGSAR